jgi:SAM-dependent methyltransferase
MSDYDPRLVELYDLDNPNGPDHDFYRRLADTIEARTIVDLGCGTGLLTVSLAGPGRTVYGIDPSPNMLRFATGRPGAAAVHWAVGDSRDIPIRDADYALMTGNVAQHIVGADWPRTLADVHRALRPGGVLAFESRDPDARAWEQWGAQPPTTRETGHGPLREWLDVHSDGDGIVTLTAHNVFDSTGDHVVEELPLAFRSRALIEDQLAEAGYAIEAVYGDWHGSPHRAGAPLMVFQARTR